MAAPQKRGRVSALGKENIRSDGAARVMELVRSLNKAYEDSDFVVGESPAAHSFNADMGFNSIQGWITCDGPGAIQVDFTRDGTTYGDKWTMYAGENTMLKALDIHTIRVTHTGADSAYRIFLI